MKSLHNLLRGIGETFAAFRSAVAVSAAGENGRQPSAHHLRRLGIDPSAFTVIGRG